MDARPSPQGEKIMKPVNSKRFNRANSATAMAATVIAGLLAACGGGGSESGPIAATIPPAVVIAAPVTLTAPASGPAVSATPDTSPAVPFVISPTAPAVIQPVDIQLPWNGNAKSPEVFESLLTYARV